jgi:hypothetical protein
MVTNGRKIYAQAAGGVQQIDADLLTYLTTITDQQAVYFDTQTVNITAQAANNPVTGLPATKAEFDVFINGMYIDKPVYTWTPSFSGLQTIIFDTVTLGTVLDPVNDVVIVKGRWS